MIHLDGVNKYFNRNRRNELHVLNNVSISFPDTGLVVILGPSGSGKTTLLNVMSGMDTHDTGTIHIDDTPIRPHDTKRLDEMRRHAIGYIHQNYHLLMELTVSENIELALKLCGMSDSEAISKRIGNLLAAVGLDAYADRLVKQLSGGQQQRVAFARALAKDPHVILADEPTGNVDSKTTIDLMAMLKRISKTRLVVMVTHETKLADHFADRIIEIANGVIMRDEANDQQRDLRVLQEQIIYLKDYQQDDAQGPHTSVARYHSGDADDLHLRLVERNDTLYVKVDAASSKHVKVIHQDSEVELRDASSADVDEPEGIDIEPLTLRDADHAKSAITLKDTFRYARRKFQTLTTGGRLMLLVLALVGMIVSIAVGMIGETFRYEQSIATQNRNYIAVTTDSLTYEEVLAFEDLEGIEQVLLINRPVDFYVESEKYYEISSSLVVSALPVDIRFLDESKLIHGTMPDGYGIVIDESLANDMIETYQHRGVETIDDVLHCSFKLQASGIDSDLPHDTALYFPITGIARDYSKSIWMSEDLMYSLVTPNLISDTILTPHMTLIDGTMPETRREVVLHETSPFLDNDEIPYSIGITTGQYFISGVYRYTDDDVDYNLANLIVTSFDYLKEEYFGNKYYNKVRYEFFLYSTDVATNLEMIQDLGYQARNAYLYEQEDDQVLKFDDNINIYVLSLSGIVACAISIFFIMRTSLISRIYEVSVYRSLGATKGNIRKMFFMEILIMTSLSALIGFVLMTLLLLQAERAVAGGVHLVHYGFTGLIGGILGIYAINVLFGLLPINTLLRRTPAAIIKQFDL